VLERPGSVLRQLSPIASSSALPQRFSQCQSTPSFTSSNFLGSATLSSTATSDDDDAASTGDDDATCSTVSSKKKKNISNAEADDGGGGGGNTDENSSDESSSEEPSENDILLAQIEEKEQQVKDLNDRLLRSMAEMENMLKRQRKELEKERLYAAESFVPFLSF
jgi:molecular chaperone GrpE